jgi:dienelactone hydrolase
MNFETLEIDKPATMPMGVALGSASASALNELPEQWLQLNEDLVVRNVRVAKLLSFPAASNVLRKNESIVIAPGGGMMVLAMSHEGVSLAEKFSALGYDAYVLQYRLNPTPRDNELFKRHCSIFYASLLQGDFGNSKVELENAEAILDLESAVKEIKKNSQCDQPIIHFLGFSAGAYLGRQYLLKNPVTHDLLSVGMIYGDLTAMTIETSKLPNLFGVMASDDPIFSRKGLGIIQTWHEKHLEPEMHFFRNGGHGFGDRITGATSDAWMTLYSQWLHNITRTSLEKK